MCWSLSGVPQSHANTSSGQRTPGGWRDQVTVTNSGPRRAFGWESGLVLSGLSWPTPVWWSAHDLSAPELCAYGWLFEQEVGGDWWQVAGESGLANGRGCVTSFLYFVRECDSGPTTPEPCCLPEEEDADFRLGKKGCTLGGPGCAGCLWGPQDPVG